MLSACEIYCWISSSFVVLSELWLADSTQLFWLKLLFKMTDSICLLSPFHRIPLFGFKLTLAIFLIYWLLILSGFNWLCWPALKGTKFKRTHLHCPAFTALTPNWLTESKQQIDRTAFTLPVLRFNSFALESWPYLMTVSFCQVFLRFITLSAPQLDVWH